MSVVLFEGLQDQIEVIIDVNDNPWFKRVHVGGFLDIVDIRFSIRGLDKCETRTRQDLDPTRSFS